MILNLLQAFDLPTLKWQLNNDPVIIEDYIQWNVEMYKSLASDLVYAVAGWLILISIGTYLGN